MDVRPRVIRAELMSCLVEVEAQMSEFKRHANAMGIEPYKMRDANGGWAYPAMLSAKCQILHSLTLLNLKENH